MLIRVGLSRVVLASRLTVRLLTGDSALIHRGLATLTTPSDVLHRTTVPELTTFGFQQKRFKQKKGAKEVDFDEEDDEDEEEFDEELGSKLVTGYMTSLRADLVLKSGLGISRNKIETLFYESKLRVNGSKLQKKSQKVQVGDELDVIKGPSPLNENLTTVGRVVVLGAKAHEDGDKLIVKMRRYKSLTVDNSD